MKYKIVVDHETYDEPFVNAGGTNTSCKDPVSINISIEIEKREYEEKGFKAIIKEILR